MNQVKQNVLVSAILFLSLLTSVALSYAITPTTAATIKADKKIELKVTTKNKKNALNQSLIILLPKKGL